VLCVKTIYGGEKEMLLIFAIIIIMIISSYSPITASIAAIFSAIYFYKSFQRTKYMINKEADMAIRLKSIKDPEEKKKLKTQIKKYK